MYRIKSYRIVSYKTYCFL